MTAKRILNFCEIQALCTKLCVYKQLDFFIFSKRGRNLKTRFRIQQDGSWMGSDRGHVLCDVSYLRFLFPWVGLKYGVSYEENIGG